MTSQTMKAVVIANTGGPEVAQVQQVPRPEIKSDQILVKNEYVGMNFIEIYFRKGLYPVPLPAILGREGAGQVAAVGKSVTQYQMGQKVGYLAPNAYADYTALSIVSTDGLEKADTNTHFVSELPAGVDAKTFASAAVQGLTAYTFIREAYQVDTGSTVLVTAAAGGTGQNFVQLCKILGATVIAVTSSQEKAAIVKKLGADFVIDYKKEKISERVRHFTKGKGVDAVFDSVGKATFSETFESLALRGTFVSFGNASGPIDPISPLALSPKNVKFLRPTLFGYLAGGDRFHKYVREYFELLVQKKVHLAVHEKPLTAYAEVQQALESGFSTGKFVFRV